MNKLTEEEKKALLYIFDIAVKSAGIGDGGAIVNNVMHFTKLMNEPQEEKKEPKK